VHALWANWKKRYAPNTLNSMRGPLGQLLRALGHHGAPATRLPRAPRKQRATTATAGELAAILQQPKPAIRLFVLLYFQCGLRRAETLRVTPRTWNREEHTVTIQVKGGDTRTAMVTADVEELFRACGKPEPDTPFLEVLHGRKLTPGALSSLWERHRRKISLRPNVNAHDLRRTAATILYNNTHDLRVAQQLLGHKNLTSTLAYLAPLTPDADTRRYAELLRFDRFHSEVKQ
jgi:integrase